MIKKCEFCGTDMILKTVNKNNAKNYGDIIKIHKNKRFCSTCCQINWQKNVKWEKRIGKEVAQKIRNDASMRVSGKNNPSCNPEVSKKISNSLKEYLRKNKRNAEKNPFFGKKHTEEYKKKASESRKGLKSCSEEQCQKQRLNTPRGENCHLWKGGKSFEPYNKCFNKKLKTQIKIRDNYECVCGKQTQKLAIHHINYDKLNSDERNLITLCYNCHSKTNFKRNKWENFFKTINDKKYDKMSENNNGMLFD